MVGWWQCNVMPVYALPLCQRNYASVTIQSPITCPVTLIIVVRVALSLTLDYTLPILQCTVSFKPLARLLR